VSALALLLLAPIQCLFNLPAHSETAAIYLGNHHLLLEPMSAAHSEAEKLEAAEEEGRNNDVWAGMDIDNPELQAGLKRAGGLRPLT
jgi:hypothetical protein